MIQPHCPYSGQRTLPVLLWIFFFCSVSFSSFAQSLPLPLTIPDSDWHPLRDQQDPYLQQELIGRINQNSKWRKLVTKQLMTVSIVDLSDPENARFAHINGDRMMYAASLPKIAILLTAMQQMEDGVLPETPVIMKDLNDMIRTSSNGAATRMIDRVGGLSAIEKVLLNEEYELYDPEYGGGLWVGKRYSQSSRRNPDPMQGLSHAATANQVSRFYYLLATGRLINPYRSEQMLEIMSNPGINHKFVNTLKRNSPWVSIFRKSGSWRNWHSDSALVWGDQWRHYIVVCLVEDPEGEQILRNLIPVVEEILIPERLTNLH